MSGLVARGEMGSDSVPSKILLLSNEGGDDVAIPMPEDASAASSTTTKVNPDNESMHKAASEGDWAAAERLLRRDEKLGWAEITEKGDRALHVAVSMKHAEFVRQLIPRIKREELKLCDGNGYTACCYAVMAGNLELVRIIMDVDPSLRNVKNWHGTTPFALAFSYGKAEIISYFLSFIEVEGLTEAEWFGHLLDVIHKRMFDVAVEILKKKGTLAEMKGGDGRTALHVLAQLDISSGWKTGDDDCLLAEKLWKNIKSLGRDKTLELMERSPILHDAAKVGNLDLIKMITDDYPHLLSRIDPDGGSLLRTIVMHRRDSMPDLVKQATNAKDFNAISLDKDGNNLLHAVANCAKSPNPQGSGIVSDLEFELERAYDWFKAVEEILPADYVGMRNTEGYTPIELFWTKHAVMLAKTQKHTKITAESCMLISTIVMTLVFTAAFSPPGGFSQETGLPVLYMKKEFLAFIFFEVMAFFCSAYSTIGFWDIISSNYRDHSNIFILKYRLGISMAILLYSILFVISAFLCASLLVFVHRKKTMVITFIVFFYVGLALGILDAVDKIPIARYLLRRGESSRKKY